MTPVGEELVEDDHSPARERGGARAGRHPAAGGAGGGPDGIEADTEAAPHHLGLKAAFGSGLRGESDYAEPAALAGLTVRTCRDIGWDHRLRSLTPTS
ncbi:hypothetical protein ACIBEA_05410 [Streptomyces sp. NPDC051555]|uniref:hypothetical protein n=1 Tax=Streptomyces sp. NPDC051555 TaxID=3365657 RepID=UPI0037BAEAC1